MQLVCALSRLKQTESASKVKAIKNVFIYFHIVRLKTHYFFKMFQFISISLNGKKALGMKWNMHLDVLNSGSHHVLLVSFKVIRTNYTCMIFEPRVDRSFLINCYLQRIRKRNTQTIEWRQYQEQTPFLSSSTSICETLEWNSIKKYNNIEWSEK